MIIDWTTRQHRHHAPTLVAVAVLHASIAAAWVAGWHPVPVEYRGAMPVDDQRYMVWVDLLKMPGCAGWPPVGELVLQTELQTELQRKSHAARPPVPSVAVAAPVLSAAPATSTECIATGAGDEDRADDESRRDDARPANCPR